MWIVEVLCHRPSWSTLQNQGLIVFKWDNIPQTWSLAKAISWFEHRVRVSLDGLVPVQPAAGGRRVGGALREPEARDQAQAQEETQQLQWRHNNAEFWQCFVMFFSDSSCKNCDHTLAIVWLRMLVMGDTVLILLVRRENQYWVRGNQHQR